MRRISPTKAAIAVGSVTGLWHLIWVGLVGLGWARPVLDFILKLHFIQLQYDLAPYAAATAAELVLLTLTIGGVFGFVFAMVWNWLSIETDPTWARDFRSVEVPAALSPGD